MQISLGSYNVLAVLSTRPTRSYWVLFRTWWEPDATTFILNMSKVNVEVHDFLLPLRLLLGPYCVSTGSSVRLWSSHSVYNSFSQISERSKIFVVKRECVIGVLVSGRSRVRIPLWARILHFVIHAQLAIRTALISPCKWNQPWHTPS